MHNQAHGAVANRIIEVEPSIVESFLGRIEDPVKARNADLNIINDPAFRILMVVRLNPKISENVKKHSNSDNRGIGLENLSTENGNQRIPIGNSNSSVELLTQIMNEFEGTEVQTFSTKKLISFRFASSALSCAQRLVHIFNSETLTSSDPNGIKIGLSSGLPFEQDEGLFKETIEHAERLCAAVEGRIVITSDLKDLYASENQNTGFLPQDVRTLSPREEHFLNSLMDFLENSYGRADLKVEHFSTNLGLSKAQLYRKVKGLTGKSLNTFVKEYRLDKALHLLLKKSGNISEVAFDTGFNSPAYFSKCFSQAYQILPSKLAR